MADQYATIGKRYKTFKDLPVVRIEEPSVLKRLGSVHGHKCLDLACGLGHWSKLLMREGAAQVVGVDISPSMIEAARQSVSAAESTKISFVVGDCSKPFLLDEGPFDLVFGSWFLNYAGDFETMVAMWKNIHDNLKPGGRFVGITNNTHCPMFEPIDDSYHVACWPIEKVGEGWRCHLRANVEPEPVEFDNYHFLHDFYERAAAEAGMDVVRWYPPVAPEGQEDGFWDVYLLRPHLNVLTASRS